MTTKSFKIAKWFVIANYFIIAGCFIIGLLFIIGLVGLWDASSLIEEAIFFIGGMSFMVGGFYSISIVPRMKETVHISENQIIHEHPDGTTVAISWNENFNIRNRLFLGRLELISQDGQRIIMIEQQINGYQEIVEFILAKQKENKFRDLNFHEKQ